MSQHNVKQWTDTITINIALAYNLSYYCINIQSLSAFTNVQDVTLMISRFHCILCFCKGGFS